MRIATFGWSAYDTFRNPGTLHASIALPGGASNVAVICGKSCESFTLPPAHFCPQTHHCYSGEGVVSYIINRSRPEIAPSRQLPRKLIPASFLKILTT